MRKITNDVFLERVKGVHGNKIKVLSEYKNRRTKVEVLCSCGHQWETNPEPLSKGSGCPVCAGNKKRTTESFKKEVVNRVGSEYEVLGDYINKDEPITFKHSCGHVFKMSPNAFLRGQRCPVERYERVSKANTASEQDVIDRMRVALGGEYEMVGIYEGASKNTEILHKKCGKTFSQKPSRVYSSGVGCPHCYSSKGELVVKKYLENIGVDYKEQVRIKECRNKRPLPFDFGIYEKGKLILLIEYDGEQHFKPKFGIKQFEATLRNDSIKNKYCEDNKIPLLRIEYKRTNNLLVLEKHIFGILEENINMIIPSEG